MGSPNPSTYATSVTFTATITSDTGNVKGGAKKNGVKPMDTQRHGDVEREYGLQSEHGNGRLSGSGDVHDLIGDANCRWERTRLRQPTRVTATTTAARAP